MGAGLAAVNCLSCETVVRSKSELTEAVSMPTISSKRGRSTGRASSSCRTRAPPRPLVPYEDFISALPSTRPYYNMAPLAVREAVAREPPPDAAPGRLRLAGLAASHQPLLFLIAEFAVARPEDALLWRGAVSFSTGAHLGFIVDAVFAKLYLQRWPAFYEAVRFTAGDRNWLAAYKRMLAGRTRCILEVFHREKKRGFAMSAMAAWVTYCSKRNAYEAKYISASAVPPEWIPASEASRLRFLPASARGALLPQRSFTESVCGCRDAYPFKVLQGTQGLALGMGVEVQWKMQEGSPFGWWYGDLERLEPHPDGVTAVATITFQHFPADSRWYRMRVRFGDAAIRHCVFGGFTGGVRPAAAAEQKLWLSFLP